MTEPWRIGNHYSIHVYSGDDPIATFHDKADAIEAVLAVNAARAAGGSANPAEPCTDPQHVANPEHHYCQPSAGRATQGAAGEQQ